MREVLVEHRSAAFLTLHRRYGLKSLMKKKYRARPALTRGRRKPAAGLQPRKPSAAGTRPYDAASARATSAASAARVAAVELSDKQRRHLRGLAHALKPIVRLGGSGLTEAVARETARALHDHELIKVRAPSGDRDARDAAFAELAQRTGSALVHRIGNVGVLFRPRPDLSRILLPDG